MFKSRFKQYIKFREKLLIIVLQLLLGLERKESLITKSLDIFLFQYNDIKLNCPHLHKIIIHSKDDKCAWKWPCNLWTMISRYGHYHACNLHIHLNEKKYLLGQMFYFTFSWVVITLMFNWPSWCQKEKYLMWISIKN